MTMHRRPIGRSRLLAAIGAIVTLVGSFLPWWTVGGREGLPVLSGNGLEAAGIIVFGVAIATLALVTLPYASERPVSLDRWLSYAALAGLGTVAFAYRLFDLAMMGVFRFAEPADVIVRIPGLWLAGIGLSILARAAYDMLGEPRLR
ncbi:MAG: hypothetical protein FIA92_02340 [Chloroflexi bacterium]|nr:hypothetical protein [Chloroflexota bacterium]